jgi:hypothetical protein
MNEKIQELIEQARKKPMGDSWCYTSPKEFEQKLAELIVFECIKIAVFKGDSATGKAIKEHFGVEDSDLHTCPYKEEISGDYDTLCDCDEEATRQCAMDV